MVTSLVDRLECDISLYDGPGQLSPIVAMLNKTTPTGKHTIRSTSFAIL